MENIELLLQFQDRCSRLKVFCEKYVLKDFAKYLCQIIHHSCYLERDNDKGLKFPKNNSSYFQITASLFQVLPSNKHRSSQFRSQKQDRGRSLKTYAIVLNFFLYSRMFLFLDTRNGFCFICKINSECRLPNQTLYKNIQSLAKYVQTSSRSQVRKDFHGKFNRSSVIRRKGEPQKRCFKKTKPAKFSKRNELFWPSWYARIRVRITVVRNVCFSENCRALFPRNTRFEIRPFALLLARWFCSIFLHYCQFFIFVTEGYACLSHFATREASCTFI